MASRIYQALYGCGAFLAPRQSPNMGPQGQCSRPSSSWELPRELRINCQSLAWLDEPSCSEDGIPKFLGRTLKVSDKQWKDHHKMLRQGGSLRQFSQRSCHLGISAPLFILHLLSSLCLETVSVVFLVYGTHDSNSMNIYSSSK